MSSKGIMVIVVLVLLLGMSSDVSAASKKAKSSHSSAKEIARDGRFIAYDNGTVLDTRTKLMWAAKDNGSDINWSDAKSYCEYYEGGGYKDWRMPTQEELDGLYNVSAQGYRASCAPDLTLKLTHLIQLSCFFTWASDTRGSDAAGFDSSNGKRDWGRQSGTYDGRALPVRSGK